MSRPPIKGRWYREVLRSPLISDSVRVLLIALHDDMQADGFVSVPRKQLAARLGKNPRRISERFEQAVAAGFLGRVRAGQPTVTAEYRAMLPNANAERVRPSSSKPIERLMQPAPAEEKAEGDADGRTIPPALGADVRTVRIAAPMEVRTTAPLPHAQLGADDPPANHSASLRFQRSGATSELPSSPAQSKRSAEVEPGTTQRRDEAEPVLVGVLIEGLFGKRGAA